MNQQNILNLEKTSEAMHHEPTHIVFPTIKTFDLNALAPSVYAAMVIDLNKTVQNYDILKNLSQPGVCGAVVKADAYGVGACAITSTLFQHGCRDFFVAYLEEAVQIKPYLPDDARIFVLNGYLPALEREFWHHQFIPVLHNTEQFERFSAFSRSTHTTQRFALHIDTGMHRTGMTSSEIKTLYDKGAFETLKPLMIMSHLSSAERQGIENAEEKERFDARAAYFPESLKSTANSSGIFLGANYTYDITRPGLALHGLNPTTAPNPMIPVISLYARIIQIQELSSGDHVGYGRTYQAKTNRTIATIAAGYADGVPWRLSNQSYVMISGQKAPIIARVSMDLITVDITGIPNIALYDFAELLHTEQTLDDWAAASGQLVYELLLSIGQRFKRYYTNF